MVLNVIYEDNHVIVAKKEAGILSQKDGSSNPDMDTIVKAYIKENYQKPGDVYLGLVHRLDRNTEGLMVFARTSKAAARLSEQIKKHDNFNKKYLTIVEGKMEIGESKELLDYLTKDEKNNKSFIDLKNGKESKLIYDVLDSRKINGRYCSLLNVTLLTGRHHQIRVQLSNIGHPLLNDIKYGAKAIGEGFYFPLVSYSLSFIHPTLKEEMSFKYFSPSKLFNEFYDKDDFLEHYHIK